MCGLVTITVKIDLQLLSDLCTSPWSCKSGSEVASFTGPLMHITFDSLNSVSFGKHPNPTLVRGPMKEPRVIILLNVGVYLFLPSSRCWFHRPSFMPWALLCDCRTDAIVYTWVLINKFKTTVNPCYNHKWHHVIYSDLSLPDNVQQYKTCHCISWYNNIQYNNAEIGYNVQGYSEVWNSPLIYQQSLSYWPSLELPNRSPFMIGYTCVPDSSVFMPHVLCTEHMHYSCPHLFCSV